MSSSYPSSLDALRTDLSGADDAAAVDHAGLHNDANAAINAVQAELGANPSGAAATVAARLDAVDADSRWADQRTPADGSVTDAKVAAGAGISPSKIAGTAVVDNDARLANARTPTAHKASHATGGSDALSPADIGAATSAQGAKADTAVQPARSVAAGTGLTGGGDLSADRTISVAAGGVGSTQLADGAVGTAKIADGSVTGAKIADGAIVDGDIAAGAAIAASKIAGTAVVASLVDAKGDLLVATADNALTRLPVGSDGRVLVASSEEPTGVKWAPQAGQITGSGSPVGVVTPSFAGQLYADTSGAKLWVATGVLVSSWALVPERATLGNLLADDLAVCATTVGTGRNTAIPTTVTVVADVGLQVASSSTYVGCFIGAGNVATWTQGPGSLPVGPVGSPMTFLVEVSSPDMTEASAVSLVFQDAAGASVGSASASFTLSASRQTVAVIGAVPAGATRAAVRVRTSNAGSGARTMILHTLSWHVGAGGRWAPPGVPVPNLGILVTETDTSGRACFVWDDRNQRLQMVYYDSGWRDVSASLVNSWSGSVFVRRADNQVMVRLAGLSGSLASSDTLMTLTSGFRPEASIFAAVCGNTVPGDLTMAKASLTSAGALAMSPRASVVSSSQTLTFSTTNPLPTALPGTAVGTIPNT